MGEKKNYRKGSEFKREERGEKHIQNLTFILGSRRRKNKSFSETIQVIKGVFRDNSMYQFPLVEKICCFPLSVKHITFLHGFGKKE